MDNCSTLQLQLPSITYIDPFAMLILAKEIRVILKTNPYVKFKIDGFEDNGYLAHMGFFRALGLDYGNAPSFKSHSSNYLPLTRKDINEELTKANSFYDYHDYIEENSQELANVLTHNNSEVSTEILTYTIREIVRNIFEHSKAECYYYCAQYWTENNTVELAIVDNGVGILSTLKENPKFNNLENNFDALKLALMPATTGKPNNDDYQWSNSGFGLYMLNQLTSDNGDFFICSMNDGIRKVNQNVYHINTRIEGTAIRIRFKPQEIDFKKKVNELALAAHKHEKFLKKEDFKPSAASLMLSKDFKDYEPFY